MQAIGKWFVTFLILYVAPSEAFAWGGLGHRTVAAIAMSLIPQKAAQMNTILGQLEKDNNFIDAASYPDEFIRDHDPARVFNPWHFADLRDDGKQFVCGNCLFKALADNLAVIQAGKRDKSEAVAIAWVLHLVGDLNQPLHMADRLLGGNNFHVTYRGQTQCKNFSGGNANVELHSAWDDCLVEELLGNISTYKGRSEILPQNSQPWLAWGNGSHMLANSVAFDSLHDGDDLTDGYIKGNGKALEVVQRQLLAGGIRLAFLLDQNFK
jgi:hypothetical protein